MVENPYSQQDFPSLTFRDFLRFGHFLSKAGWWFVVVEVFAEGDIFPGGLNTLDVSFGIKMKLTIVSNCLVPRITCFTLDEAKAISFMVYSNILVDFLGRVLRTSGLHV